VYSSKEKRREWFYHVGDHSETGKYISGLRDGVWKYFYENGNLQFEGKYIQGNLDGRVRLFYDDGKIMEEQFYINGIKEKTWKKYDRQGNIILTVTYQEDIEVRINGVKVEDSEREVKLIR
jgi:antitoxin component YwqK of YwqJK toxin-antitoxin module